jgi:hypothetical protein
MTEGIETGVESTLYYTIEKRQEDDEKEAESRVCMKCMICMINERVGRRKRKGREPKF